MISVQNEDTLEGRYGRVCEGISRAARNAGRDPAYVQLVVASKMQSAGTIEKLIQLGHRVFGENRVQEAMEKWPSLKASYPDLQLHLIGPLQTNKVRDAVRLFDVIETVDRDRLAQALAAEEVKQNKNLRYLIEVNAGREAQKSGVLPEDVAALLSECRDACHLRIDGFMCIPPAAQQASPYFALLAEMAKKQGLQQLSMGMTADYPLAIQLGATHVRVGTAIFGERTSI
jgi:pyridoxal phosphate enzyme (YggS family)